MHPTPDRQFPDSLSEGGGADRSLRSWIIPAAVGVLFGLSFALRLYVLLSSRYAFGADGYYYAAQVRSYWLHGRFFSPDSSLPLYFLTYFSRLGDDIVLMNKVAVALLASAIAWPSYLLGRTLSGQRGGLVAAAILTSSSFAVYFTFEFVKNLGGIFFFLFFLHRFAVLLQRTRSGAPPWRDATLLLFFFVLVFLSHKLMAGLAIAVLPVGLVLAFWSRRRILWACAAGLFVCVGAAAVLLPNVLHLADFSRVSGILSWRAGLPALAYIRTEHPPWWNVAELLVLCLAPLTLPVTYRNIRPAARLLTLVLAGTVILANAPFLIYRTDNLTFRFLILAFIPGGLILSALWERWHVAAAVAAALLCLPAQWVGLRQAERNSPFDYELYDGLLPLIELPENHLLIVHQGFDYFYCYSGRGDAFHFLPEAKHRARPIFRLVHGLPLDMLAAHLDVKREVRILPGYYLMPEATYQKFLSRAPAAVRRRLHTWRNPHIRRPGYMLRNEKLFKKDPARTKDNPTAR